MTADTDRYVGLQEVYRQKARKDLVKVRHILESNCPGIIFPTEIVEWVVSNASALQVVDCRSVLAEYDSPRAQTINEAVRDLEYGHHGVFYVLMRASDLFVSRHGRRPENADLDAGELRSCVLHILQNDTNASAASSTVSAIPDELISEMCRYGGSQLHNIAAIIGGIAAQEVIKLLTRQKAPLKNTLVFNGIACGSSVLDL
jgi:amyloid beta precursor protein binding protein 1